MMRSVLLAVTERSVTKMLVTDTPVGRAVARRFVAGDTLASAIEVTGDLNRQGLKVSLDHLGENGGHIFRLHRDDEYLSALYSVNERACHLRPCGEFEFPDALGPAYREREIFGVPPGPQEPVGEDLAHRTCTEDCNGRSFHTGQDIAPAAPYHSNPLNLTRSSR